MRLVKEYGREEVSQLLSMKVSLEAQPRFQNKCRIKSFVKIANGIWPLPKCCLKSFSNGPTTSLKLYITTVQQGKDVKKHCMKNFQIRCFFSFEYGKIWARKNFEKTTFHTVNLILSQDKILPQLLSRDFREFITVADFREFITVADFFLRSNQIL